jgi:hypothetical protein
MGIWWCHFCSNSSSVDLKGVAKSEGPAPTLATTDPACLVLIVRSLIDRHLFPLRPQSAHCLTADLFVFEDLQTIKHLTGHSTAHNVFSHICIKTALHFIHKVYTYSDSTSMSLQKHESDRFWSSDFSSTSSILLQLELSYLTNAAEDQNLAKKLLATEFSLLFLLSFSQNLSPHYCFLYCPTSIFFFPSSSLLYQASFSPTVFWSSSSDLRCFIQKFLQISQRRSNPIPSPPSH